MASTPRPFLSLPSEIREHIYVCVLTVNVESAEPWITPLNQELRPMPGIVSCLAILATCRQILREAFYVYYRMNTFNFNHPDHLYDFLRAIGSVRANEIRSIRCSFRLAARENTAARYILSRLMRLEKLAFQFDAEKPDDHNIPHWQNFILQEDFCSAKEFAKINVSHEVNFVMMNDDEPSALDKERMEAYRDRMIKLNPKRRKPPPEMVDLFTGLKMRKHRDPAVARRRKIREENEAHRKHWVETIRKLEQRTRLELLSRQGEEARREQGQLDTEDETSQGEDNELAEFLSTELWIRDAISG